MTDLASPVQTPSAGSVKRYSATAIAFHWLLALMIFGSLIVGWYMADLEISPLKLKLFNWHKWAGITILLLSLLRLLWRLRHAPPPAVPMPAWQQQAALWGHRLMYLMFFVVPLAGWAYSSASGFQVVWFGVLPLPDWVPKDKELAEVLEGVHGAAAYTLLALVIVHIAAVVKHQFVERDNLLARMRPGGRGS